MTNAPIQTDFHLTFVSGKNLNMRANKIVMMTREKTKLSKCRITNKDSDQCCDIHEDNAESKDERTSETSNKNAMEIIKPKEKNLDLRNDQIPDLVVDALTSQIIFKHFCS